MTKHYLAALTLSLTLAASVSVAQEPSATPDATQTAVLAMAQKIRKAIVTLPQYSVFDSIHFAIKGQSVILRGKASRPTLKSGAENVVKKIEGVQSVDNQIEVLPASPNDDKIRAAVYASIYRYPVLQKYTSNRGGPKGPSIARAAGGITNDPPIGYHAIHILVENGNVTLTGVVDSETDLSVAYMRANSVPGVFSVDNDLQVATKSK